MSIVPIYSILLSTKITLVDAWIVITFYSVGCGWSYKNIGIIMNAVTPASTLSIAVNRICWGDESYVT